mgnify:CR=1 FL=1
MYKIGLTGGIGSGKTYIAEIFSRLEIPVFNSDIEGKKCMHKDDSVREQIINSFGKEIYSNNKLDTGKLANIVFNNNDLLEHLNAIIHPVVIEKFNIWVSEQNSDIVIKESAILFESGTNKGLDKIICVSAPEGMRIQRIIDRDRLTKEEILSRIKNQISQEKKEKLSDFIIQNDGKELILPQILNILELIKN